MATKKTAGRHGTGADTTAAVDAFMAGLDHPHKAAIHAVAMPRRRCAASTARS